MKNQTISDREMRKRRWRLWLIKERIKNAIEKRKRNGPPGHMESLTKRTRDTLNYVRQKRQRMKEGSL